MSQNYSVDSGKLPFVQNSKRDYKCNLKTIHKTVKSVAVLLRDCLIGIFLSTSFRQNRRDSYVKFCKCSIIYEMQFQIKDGPACLCFCLFRKRSVSKVDKTVLPLPFLQSYPIKRLVGQLCGYNQRHYHKSHEITETISGQNLPGQNPPGQNPPGQNPPRTKSP